MNNISSIIINSLIRCNYNVTNIQKELVNYLINPQVTKEFLLNHLLKRKSIHVILQMHGVCLIIHEIHSSYNNVIKRTYFEFYCIIFLGQNHSYFLKLIHHISSTRVYSYIFIFQLMRVTVLIDRNIICTLMKNSTFTIISNV